MTFIRDNMEMESLGICSIKTTARPLDIVQGLVSRTDCREEEQERVTDRKVLEDRTMKKVMVGLLIVVVSSVGTTCGTTGVPSLIHPLTTNVVRPRQVGDSYEYALSRRTVNSSTAVSWVSEGTIHSFTTELDDPVYGTVSAINGTTTETVVEGEGVGNVSVSDSQSRDVREPSGYHRWVASRGGASDNEVTYIITPDGGVPPDTDMTVDVGDSYSYEAVFDEGSELAYSETVVATETVTVPAGTFEAYKVEFTSILSNNAFVGRDVRSGAYWIVPALGTIKRVTSRSATLTNGQPGTGTTTIELVDTNIPF